MLLLVGKFTGGAIFCSCVVRLILKEDWSSLAISLVSLQYSAQLATIFSHRSHHATYPTLRGMSNLRVWFVDSNAQPERRWWTVCAARMAQMPAVCDGAGTGGGQDVYASAVGGL